DHPWRPAQTAFQAMAQTLQAPAVGLSRAGGSPDGRPKTGDASDILGSCPMPPLLAAAAEQRLAARNTVREHQRPDPLGSTDLVRRNGRKISPQRLDFERYFSDSLNRIDVQQSTRFMDDRSCLLDRLKSPGLVVGSHNRNQRGRLGRKFDAEIA